MLDFERVQAGETEKIEALSALATAIVREHFDPIIGRAQNDYMLAMFQTVPAITGQLEHGYRYYFVVEEDGAAVAFVSFLDFEGLRPAHAGLCAGKCVSAGLRRGGAQRQPGQPLDAGL